jgi:membrane protein implicated in regulation of membrane protease activity
MLAELVFMERRGNRDDEGVGLGCLRRHRKIAGGEGGLVSFAKSRFVNMYVAAPQYLEDARVDVHASDLDAVGSEGGGRGEADVTQTEDTDRAEVQCIPLQRPLAWAPSIRKRKLPLLSNISGVNAAAAIPGAETNSTCRMSGFIIPLQDSYPACACVRRESQLLYNGFDFPNEGRMEIMLNPNMAYLLLVAGTLFTLTAIMVPGTGIQEILALFLLVLAGYTVYHLGINWWALAIMILSLLPFFFAVRGPRRELWLEVSILGLSIGSVFFFPSAGGLISVDPVLAVVTTVLYAAFLWMAARKVVQTAISRPAHDLSTLLGERGEAKTAVRVKGSVQVDGELWSARSEDPIAAGRPIRIAGREGFVLIVEEDRRPESQSREE